jgi:glycosyltransferase involved in cell wall biosynthesis
MKKMLLCYVLPEYNPQTEQHFFHLYSLLQKLSTHYSIYLIIERGDFPTNFPQIPVIWLQKQKRSFFRALEMFWLLSKARFQGCHLFYTHYSSFGGFLAAVVTHLWGGRSFYWNCETNKDHWVSWSLKNLKTKLKIEIPTYLTIYYSHHLVTGTPWMAEYYRKVYHLKKGSPRVIPNWVEPEHFHKKNEEGEAFLACLPLVSHAPVILYVHRMAPRKGAHHLVPLVQKIRKEIPLCQFLFVGGGPSLEALQKSFSTDPLVFLTGALPHRLLSAFYQRADLFIMPSEQEGFPRVLLEAMIQELAFVCTDVGGVRDILTEKQREYMVRRGDLEGFARKTIELLRSPDKRKALEGEGCRQIQHFTLEKTLEKFLQTVKI